MATVTDQAPRARVAERLTRLRAADERLSRALDAVVAAVAQIPKQAIDREPVSALETTVSALREPLPPDVARVSTGESETSGIVDQPPSETAASEAIQAAFGAVSDAGAAATALFTTARLMYQGAVCTFADGRSQRYAATSKALHELLPQVVAWELREAGMYCQCICPMCGLGACGCIWASLHTIDVAWNRPGLPGPDERGVVLRSPPRPGSQLADAGVSQWAYITSLDGDSVRSAPELQKALRQRSIGEEARLRIEENGHSREIVVRHLSDIG